MAKIAESMLKVKSKKNQIDISCDKFLKELSGKDDMFEIGKFNINTQLTLNGVQSIDSNLEQTIQKEAARILSDVAKKIETNVKKLREGVGSKQKEEKDKGNTKAADEADGMVKKINSLIADEINGLGTTIRSEMKKTLKSQGLNPKIKTVNRNSVAKIKLGKKAFKGGISGDFDKKTWGNLGKKIDDVAFATGHKNVEDYISKANALHNQIKEFTKGGGKKDEESHVNEIRTGLVEFKKSIDDFQKQLKQGKELANATKDMKKQKGKLEKADAGLKKNLETMEKSHKEMEGELKRFATMTDTALKMINSGKTDRLGNLGPMFQSAAKQMSTLSHKMSPITKQVAEQTKKKTKK